jgi:hypothetical protein
VHNKVKQYTFQPISTGALEMCHAARTHAMNIAARLAISARGADENTYTSESSRARAAMAFQAS